MKPQKIELAQKLTLFQEHWSPKIIGEVNDCAVGPTTKGRPTAVGSAGERPALTWSSSRGNSSGTSEKEDELLLVLKGQMQIQFRKGVT